MDIIIKIVFKMKKENNVMNEKKHNLYTKKNILIYI